MQSWDLGFSGPKENPSLGDRANSLRGDCCLKRRAEVNSISERLYYENVIRELGDSSEILYLSVANAALAHLPYLIALDHQSRQSPHKHFDWVYHTNSIYPSSQSLDSSAKTAPGTSHRCDRGPLTESATPENCNHCHIQGNILGLGTSLKYQIITYNMIQYTRNRVKHEEMVKSPALAGRWSWRCAEQHRWRT